MKPTPLTDSIKYAFEVAHTRDGWISTFASAVKGVTFETAAWKPAPRVASIWELTLHASNYVDNLLNDLTGQPRKEHKDWPKPTKKANAEWQRTKKDLLANIAKLHVVIGELSDDELLSPPPGLKAPRVKRILDITIHDAYHAGQVMKLKQLYRLNK